MSTSGGSSYLDTIFGALRACGRDLLSSQQWLARAEQTKDVGWRFAFLTEARAKWRTATASLAEVDGHLGAGTGPRGDLATPLDQLHANVAALREKLAAHEKKLQIAGAELAISEGGRRGTA